MKRPQPDTSTRLDIWKSAAFTALVTALVVLVVVKFFTAIAFMTAFLFAVAVFMIAFGFAIRLSPRRHQ